MSIIQKIYLIFIVICYFYLKEIKSKKYNKLDCNVHDKENFHDKENYVLDDIDINTKLRSKKCF